MAATAVQEFDSPNSVTGYHFRVSGCLAGINSINLVTLIGIQWPTNFIPSFVQVFPIYDGTYTVASKFMFDPTTLTNTNIDIYCDATGSTSCDIWVV